jgi:hypothetical protein
MGLLANASINKPTALNLNARLVSSTYAQIGSSFSNNGGTSINFFANNLPQGVYYLEIYFESSNLLFLLLLLLLLKLLLHIV